MRLIVGFIVGFIFCLVAVHDLAHYTWRYALLSLSCKYEGRAGVWDSERGHWCVNMDDAYPEQEAFDRLIASVRTRQEERE